MDIATALGRAGRTIRAFGLSATGAALVVAGAALAWPPAGFLVAGAFLLAVDWRRTV